MESHHNSSTELPGFRLGLSIFPIPVEILQFPNVVVECNSWCIFCIPFLLFLLKFFWPGNNPAYSWTISTVGYLMPIWLLEHHSTWEKPSMQHEVVWQRRLYFSSPHSTFYMCIHAETHTPLIATKQPAFWRSRLRCSWWSQNLDLNNLSLLLEIFKVIWF